MGALRGRRSPEETSPGPDPEHEAREIRAALSLAAVDRLGPRSIHELLEDFGTFRTVLRAARARDPGVEARVGAKRARAIRRASPVTRQHLSRIGQSGITVRVRGIPGYPERLTHLYDPPPVLYLRGEERWLERPAVAVVGTRRATEYGRRAARDVAMGLAEAGVCVVSGMARGIDARAHEAALDAGGATVGVLGSGLDHRYPAANRRLYDRMEDDGLLVSEFPPAQTPRSGFFPRRNRIIAALARAVVVVQAGRRSGALNTAGHALDLGREVFAVPGPVGISASEGVHSLLRDGAGVCEGAADVLEELGVGEGDRSAGDEPADEEASRPWRRAREALAQGARSADELAEATGVRLPELLARLTGWELDGRIEAVPGGRYGLRARPGTDGGT